MTQKEKNILIKELCMRIPYGVKCNINGELCKVIKIDIECQQVYLKKDDEHGGTYSIARGDIIKPYLRPMSSMTEEEIYELKKICDEEDLRDECGDTVSTIYGMTVLYGEVEDVYPYNLKIKISPNLNYSVLDFLNAHHFDYRGLIPMNLALPAPEEMYNTKTE